MRTRARRAVSRTARVGLEDGALGVVGIIGVFGVLGGVSGGVEVAEFGNVHDCDAAGFPVETPQTLRSVQVRVCKSVRLH